MVVVGEWWVMVMVVVGGWWLVGGMHIVSKLAIEVWYDLANGT